VTQECGPETKCRVYRLPTASRSESPCQIDYWNRVSNDCRLNHVTGTPSKRRHWCRSIRFFYELRLDSVSSLTFDIFHLFYLVAHFTVALSSIATPCKLLVQSAGLVIQRDSNNLKVNIIFNSVKRWKCPRFIYTYDFIHQRCHPSASINTYNSLRKVNVNASFSL